MTFSDSLKRFREDLHLTQKQVADAIGIQASAYQAYEYGKVKPSVEVLSKIADAFNVSTDYLLGRSNNPRLHVFEESPKVTNPDFLDNLIFKTRIDHAERLRQVEGKIDNPAVEYADNLLRHYHRALIPKLIAAGLTL